MVEPQQQQAGPRIAVDPPPQSQSFVEPHARHPNFAQRKPPGPQIWAIVLTLGGLYYIWTRVLGKSLPSFAQRGHSVGAKGHSTSRQAEIQAARERQQERLQTANRAHEMVKQAKNQSNVRERTNVTSSGNNSANNITIQQRQQMMKQQQQQKQKQQELEEKKKKQRQLYLKQKALKEKEEEQRRKDEEQGPGWRYREDPNAAANAVNNLDPQSGSGGGGYKSQTRTRRGG